MDQIHVMMSLLPQYEVQDDFSLLIRRPTAYNGGLYTLTASNGVAGPVAASTKVTAASWQPPVSLHYLHLQVIVYPIPASISLTPDTGRTIYTPGVTATLTCNVTGDCTALYCIILYCTVL